MEDGLYYPEKEEEKENAAIAEGEARAIFDKYATAKSEVVDKSSIQYDADTGDSEEEDIPDAKPS